MGVSVLNLVQLNYSLLKDGDSNWMERIALIHKQWTD
jgi:hypothetical protein